MLCALVTSVLPACGPVSGSDDPARTTAHNDGRRLYEERARALVIAVTAEPQTLLAPYAVDLTAGQLSDLIYQRLAEPVAGFSTVGDRDYRPGLAASWSWGTDSTSLTFRIDPQSHWHDGRPVTSRDVRFTYALLGDSRARIPRPPLASIVDSVTTPDDRTAVVWTRRRTPTLFHDITYPAHILPAHLLDTVPPAALLGHAIGRHPIGSGPFRLRRWAPGLAIELDAATLTRTDEGVTPTPSSSGAASRVVARIYPGYDAAFAALLSGDVDVFDAVRGHDLARVERMPRLAISRFPGLSYAMLQFNLRAPEGGAHRAVRRPLAVATRGAHPLLGDARVRRALAMAIDRNALVGNLLHGAGTPSVGPLTRAQATWDPAFAGTNYDPTGAARLLDSAGWTVGRDGTRHHSGQPLAFTLLVPTSSAVRRAAAVLIQQSYARLGVRVDIQAEDHATMLSDLQRGAFDAALTALSVDPDPDGVRDAWGSDAARTGRGFNYGGYSNPVVDALLDSAREASDPIVGRALYRRAYRTIIADAPAAFLYEPVGVVVHDRRWRPAGLRPDAWWAGIASWTHK